MKELLKELLAAMKLETSESPLSDKNLTEKQVLKELHKLSLLNTNCVAFEGDDSNLFEIDMENYLRNRFMYSFKQGGASFTDFLSHEFDYVSEMLESLLVLIDKLLNPDRYTNVKRDDLAKVIASRNGHLNCISHSLERHFNRLLKFYIDNNAIPEGEFTNIFTTEAAIDFGVPNIDGEERYGRFGIILSLIPAHNEPIPDEEFARRLIREGHVESMVYNEMMVFKIVTNVTLPDILENENRKQMFIYLILVSIFNSYLREIGGLNVEDDPYESNCMSHMFGTLFRYIFLGGALIEDATSFRSYITHGLTFLVMKKYFSISYRDLIMLVEDIAKLAYALDLNDDDMKEYHEEVNDCVPDDDDDDEPSVPSNVNDKGYLKPIVTYPIPDSGHISKLRKINSKVAINPIEIPDTLDNKLNTNNLKLKTLIFGLEKLFNINQ